MLPSSQPTATHRRRLHSATFSDGSGYAASVVAVDEARASSTTFAPWVSLNSLKMRGNSRLESVSIRKLHARSNQ